MLRLTCLTTALLLSAIQLSASGGLDGHSREEQNRRVPVLLELFTSEGCSSCPPADRLLATFDRKQPVAAADLIVLSEHVDYWDGLGWKDPSSSVQYTARQEQYAEKLKLEGSYTPQLVVDGRYAFVGSDERAALAAIGKSVREPKLAISISDVTRTGKLVTAHIAIPAVDNSLLSEESVLYVALADNEIENRVLRGENAGRSLEHVAVARVLKQVGGINRSGLFAKDVELPVVPGSGAKGLRIVAFVQDAKTGHVLGVAEHLL